MTIGNRYLMSQPMMKICSRCGIEKDATPENFHIRCKSGPLRGVCKKCDHAQAVRRLSHRRETQPFYYEEKRLRDRRYREKERIEQRLRRLEVKRIHNKKYHTKLLMLRREKYRIDHAYRLRVNVAREMRKQLVRGKGGMPWETGVGYTVDALRTHLERQFTDNMSWENYGAKGWHIDHIVPVAKFKIKEFGDAEFRACWALSNLRPLWSEINRRKRDNREHLL